MTTESVLGKVKKLLKLGESPNANESAAAIAKAQAMMDQHRITEAMLDTHTEEPEEDIQAWADPLGRAGARWRGWLASELGKANGCQIYRSSSQYKVIGTASNTQAVRYLFGYCAREIDRLAGQYGGNGRTWLNNFRLGCVQAIREAIKREQADLRARLRTEAQQDGQFALVKLNTALAKVDDQYSAAVRFGRVRLGLRSGSASRSTYDSGARQAGRQAGRNIYPGRGSRQIGTNPKRIGN